MLEYGACGRIESGKVDLRRMLSQVTYSGGDCDDDNDDDDNDNSS
jgi:quinol-cytochrome oxidoreductase complex cytochrome b subunit